MSRSSSRSLFGVPGSRGTRASVSSLDGLRKILGNDQERELIPQARASLQRADVPDSSAPSAADDVENKQTLRGLNDRLAGYLERVKRLRLENQDLQSQIDEIEAKRKEPRGRDWKRTMESLQQLKKKIKDITLENAKILLQINNSVLANEDFKKKMEAESKASRELDQDLEDMKKTLEENKHTQSHLQKEMDLLKKELAHQTAEHQAEVDSLCEKIKHSKVTVEIEVQSSNLADIVRNIRGHYEKVAEKNMKEMDNWYCTKFENIQVEEAQNQEALESGKSELKDLLKQKKILEIQIQTLITTIKSLEDTILKTKGEYSLRLLPISDVIRDLQNQLAEVTLQVEQQSEQNRDLLGIKMKLEQEIQKYDDLMCGITDPQSMEFSLDAALNSDPRSSHQSSPSKQQEQQKATTQQSAPPAAPPAAASAAPPAAPPAAASAAPPAASPGEKGQAAAAVSSNKAKK